MGGNSGSCTVGCTVVGPLTCDRGSGVAPSASLGSASPFMSSSSSDTGPGGWLGGDGHGRGRAAAFVFEQRALLPGRQLEQGFFALAQTQFTHRPLPLQRQHWGIVWVEASALNFLRGQ